MNSEKQLSATTQLLIFGLVQILFSALSFIGFVGNDIRVPGYFVGTYFVSMYIATFYIYNVWNRSKIDALILGCIEIVFLLLVTGANVHLSCGKCDGLVSYITPAGWFFLMFVVETGIGLVYLWLIDKLITSGRLRQMLYFLPVVLVSIIFLCVDLLM